MAYFLAAQPLRAQPAADATAPDQLLLREYHPRSIYNIPQTRVEKARFPVIDVHTHTYVKTPAQVEQWVRTLDDVGITKCIILSAVSGPAFDNAVALFKPYPDRFEVWCGIDYTGFEQPGFTEHAIAELERCHQAGARGVGELVDKGRGMMRPPPGANAQTTGMHFDDPRMDPVLEKCAELHMPLNIHVGEDRWMYEPMDGTNDGLMNAFKWKIAKAPEVLDHDEVIATLQRAVAKHPHTTFIACHLANCCADLSVLGRMLDAYPNLYADLGARFRETAPIPRTMAKFFDRYQDRLLYGTDMGVNPEMYRATFRILETEDEHFYADALRGYHWPLHGFGLKDEVLRKVYAENARRILSQALSR
jgi:predicted TIM-barrel fold metal-dependent hydrolase